MESTLKDIQNLTRYNLWANKRITKWLLSNDIEKLDASCNSSFSTIGLTVSHIWEGEIFYLSILNQIPFTKKRDNTTAYAIKGLIAHSEKIIQYASQLDISALRVERSVQVKSLSGTFTQSQLIQHCINHSTYHRGQIVTMAHQLQLSKAPSTDLFFYLNLIQKSNSERI